MLQYGFLCWIMHNLVNIWCYNTQATILNNQSGDPGAPKLPKNHVPTRKRIEYPVQDGEDLVPSVHRESLHVPHCHGTRMRRGPRRLHQWSASPQRWQGTTRRTWSPLWRLLSQDTNHTQRSWLKRCIFLLFFCLIYFCLLFAAFWSSNLSFACYLLHFKAKISHWRAICGISELKPQVWTVFATFGFSPVMHGFQRCL